MAKVDEKKLQYILSVIEELEYGAVSITIHENEITQIDSTEKKRFPVAKREVRHR
ncbi:YezD family protein [Aciduricibacillus chroicocephali]|uniref:YezD family protein n=1 Tax=Aciduricibacillus chroicocephali TaxID=3054939 RepID=A0ABY9KVZ7_9BACI|nr:YezD family protein [Bacillaceae bacterium 44XB]